MTCKDCIHCDICAHRHFCEAAGTYVESCNDFKDKSRIIEFPCEIGQTVYYIHNNEILECVVSLWFVSKETTCAELQWGDNHFRNADGMDFVVSKHYDYVYFAAFGTIVFLTREEAEKAFKEMKA